MTLAGCGGFGCGTLSYLLQAGQGQLALINRARPIDEVVRDPRTPSRTRALLAEVAEVKNFGETRGLKRTKNYSDYVQLDRPAAVWVVSASEKLKFKSREWSFPIVGKVPYLGWFDRKRADEFGLKLEAEGWDVDVRGAGAYSTLGWFRDPILSSMIGTGDPALGALVNVVLHESVHATFYIAGQAYFDESLAAFVGDRLTEEYLLAKYGKDAPENTSYLKWNRGGDKLQQRLHETYLELEKLYASGKTDAEKMAEKERILDGLKEELKFHRRINNATLIDHKEYNTGLAEFAKIFEACGRDWGRFWGVVQKVNERSFARSNESDIAPLLLSLINSCR